MKKRKIVLWSVVALTLMVFIGTRRCGSDEAAPEVVVLTRGPFEVWSVYEGVLEARSLKSIMSKGRGAVTVEEIVSQGTAVREGDVLARFDASDVERDIVRLERDLALARAELESLEYAKLPLEVRDLESRLLDAKVSLDAEEQYLVDTRELLEEDLVSAQEVKQQETRAEAARKLAANLEVQLALTKEYLHPSALERARATLDSAQQEMEMAKEKLSSCVVLAPVDGIVVYRPVHVGGEYRTLRVGDTVYRNQTIMVLPDMTDPVVQCNVPEAELSRVAVGSRVVVTPVSYPDLRLEGEVESVGSMAQNVAGRPGWQKYFLVMIRLHQNDPRLRSGMSVRANVLSYAAADGLTIPRAAVHWDGEAAWVEVGRIGGRERRDVVLGMTGDQQVEVRSGLEPGDKVVVR